MKRNLIIGIATIGLASFYACGGSETEGEGNENDTTIAVIDTLSNEEPEVLAFDGVDKGNYTLYGHSEINAVGDESSVADMMTSIKETGGFDGKVMVNINEVCQKAGCWITFNNTNDESIRVFFRDHFTIPVETPSGTEAILYGQAVQDTLTVDFQKHLLDDAAENGKEVSQEEYDAITEDKIETTFDCEAILVKK